MTDNAKELLALKPGEAIGLELLADRDLAERCIPETFQQELRALRRLSARQQASIESLTIFLCDTQDRLGPGCDERAIAEAAFRKYNIFEKVEG